MKGLSNHRSGLVAWTLQPQPCTGELAHTINTLLLQLNKQVLGLIRG